jgi:HemK-related putative methylase
LGAPARYLPAEDTYLLRDALRSRSGRACLELGFGTGAVISSLSEKFQLAVGTDIVGLGAARLARSDRVDLVLSDRANCFRDGCFDLVFFNPPYLPSALEEDSAVDGGTAGIEVPISFLEEGLRVLGDEGTIMALLSDSGDVQSFVRHCVGLDLLVEQVAQAKLFYESLVVLKITRNKGRRSGRYIRCLWC